jgi:predicted dehydrogenase
MLTKPWRAVLVGCGGISKAWLDALKGRQDVAVVGLVDLDLLRAEARRAEFGLTAETGTDLAAVLAKVRPDVVCDCTVPVAHEAVATTAFAHGCHVLAEKPLAASLDAAKRIVAGGKAAGKTHAVMQNRRYLPGIRRVKALLDSGAIGHPTELHADFYVGAHFGGFRDEMRHVLLLDMAIHTVDQARFLGGVDPVAVNAVEWNPHGSWYRHDASALLLAEMSDGVRFSYRGSWCAEGLGTTWEASWRVIGGGGTILWDGGANLRAEHATGEGFVRATRAIDVPPETALPLASHAGCIDDMFRALASGGKPPTAGDDNIKSLALVHAAIASAERGGERVVIADML